MEECSRAALEHSYGPREREALNMPNKLSPKGQALYDSLRSELQESISMLRTVVRNDHPSLNDTVEKAVLAPAEALVSQARITVFPPSPFFIPILSNTCSLLRSNGLSYRSSLAAWGAADALAAARLLDGRGAVADGRPCPTARQLRQVDPRMSKHDLREYLEKVYQAPVRSVRTEVQMGEILWNSKTDYQYKKAMWKEEDKKYAYVFMEKNCKFVFPMELTFSESEEVREIEKHKEQMEKIGENSKFVNSDRGTVGRLLS
uniref:Large ribosomal subunit protein uL23m n=1 Tax=Pristionchus pacificus TaxID=54126 RepID=A0A8R1YAA9_PRIPA